MNALDSMKQMVKLVDALKYCRNNTCLNEEDVELKKAFDGALIAVLAVLEHISKKCINEWERKK